MKRSIMFVTLMLGACGSSSSKKSTGGAKDDKAKPTAPTAPAVARPDAPPGAITCAHVVPNAATYFPGATLHETIEPWGPSCTWSASVIHNETALVMVSCMTHYDAAKIDEHLKIAKQRITDLQMLDGVGKAAWLGHTTLGGPVTAGEVFDDDTPCTATIAIGSAWDAHAKDVAHDIVTNITPADVKP
jgi:hypothetical protein